MTTPNYYKKYLKYKNKYNKMKTIQGGGIFSSIILVFVSNASTQIKSTINQCSGWFIPAIFKNTGVSCIVYDPSDEEKIKLYRNEYGKKIYENDSMIGKQVKSMYENIESKEVKEINKYYSEICDIECNQMQKPDFMYHSTLLVVKKYLGMYTVCKDYELLANKCESKIHRGRLADEKKALKSEIAAGKQFRESERKRLEEQHLREEQIKAAKQRQIEQEHARMIAASRPILPHELSHDAQQNYIQNKISEKRAKTDLDLANRSDQLRREKYEGSLQGIGNKIAQRIGDAKSPLVRLANLSNK